MKRLRSARVSHGHLPTEMPVGRVRGPASGRSPRALVVLAVGCTAAGGLGAVALGVARIVNVQDPRDAYTVPSWRPVGDSPAAVPIGDGIPVTGRRALVVFVPLSQYASLAAKLADGVQSELGAASPPVDVIAVLPARTLSAFNPTPVAYDSNGRIAAQYGLRADELGQPTTGYALVDAYQRVRVAQVDKRVIEDLGAIAADAVRPH